MHPVLKEGDLVLLQRVEITQIQKGDLVGFISEKNIPLVHRVVKKTRMIFQTVADAGRRADPPINIKNIVGKVMMVKVNNKWKHVGNNRIMKILGFCIAVLSDLIVQYPYGYPILFVRKIVAKTSRFALQKSSSRFRRNPIN